MGKIGSKGALGIALSHIEPFNDPKVSAEQYMTDPEIGASVLWQLHMSENLQKVSVDLGCGTGLLGIGLLLLGAKKVHFVDSDVKVIAQAQQNLKKVKSEYLISGSYEFHCCDISEFSKSVSLVVQNPPFGVKVRYADREFLKKAVKISKVIYSFHKSESRKFIEKFSSENGFLLTNVFDFKWPLKASYSFHSHRLKYIPVSCFVLKKS